jgi:hypothetical protein
MSFFPTFLSPAQDESIASSDLVVLSRALPLLLLPFLSLSSLLKCLEIRGTSLLGCICVLITALRYSFSCVISQFGHLKRRTHLGAAGQTASCFFPWLFFFPWLCSVCKWHHTTELGKERQLHPVHCLCPKTILTHSDCIHSCINHMLVLR